MRRLALRLALAVAVVVALGSAARADWEVKRSPFDARVVARYKQLLHHNPDDAAALQKLMSLYRQYRSLAELERELGERAAQSRDANDVLVVGHLARARGDFEAAARHYRQALGLAPNDRTVLVALADAETHLGRGQEARPRYQQALALTRDPKQKRALLRRLADLALAPDRGLAAEAAVAEARGWFEQLLALDPHDTETRRELAEALAAHGQPKEAAAEWRKIAADLGRDPARQGQALARLGELEEQAGDQASALDAYQKAYALAPHGHYLRREAAEKIVGIYRKRDRLRQLIAEWEQKWPAHTRGFGEWELLARLYDEIGETQKAEDGFQKALALDPHAIDSHKRLIALYERVGKEQEAIAQYRRLIHTAPGEPRFRLALAERLMKTGDGRKEALALCAALGRETSDPSVHAQLAELYTRWGLTDLALAEQQLLVRLEPDDEAHLVALGELYYQRNNKRRALEVWRRLLEQRGVKREQAMARLAEVYAEHDLVPEAIDLYEKARRLAPDDAALKKGYAGVLERMHRDREAEELWDQLFAAAARSKQRSAQLEARQHLLTLLGKQGQARLAQRAGDYRALGEREKDEAVGAAFALFAADALVKLGRLESAEEILTRLTERRDAAVRADGWIGLAQVHRARHRLKEAVAALEKAAELAPERARELYAQIAELSLQLYRDHDALSYARRAVELAPGDAQAQVRLGEILEKSDDIAGASRAYARALELNDRQWKVYFTLARLDLRRGQYAEAAELYRAVIRRAPEEELVVDAARRALDLEEYLGSLGELEHELLPLAYAHADKPVYRNLLLELYDRYAPPLDARAREGDAQARAELGRLGERGLRPLLDVLVDGDAQQQRLAVTLLGQLGNPSAAAPLLKLAAERRARPRGAGGVERDAHTVELRTEAALAAARLVARDDLAPVVKLAGDPERHLRLAAMAALGRIAEPGARGGGPDARAVAALGQALGDGTPEVQALACLGLGRAGGARALELAEAVAREPGRSEPARVACAYAVGFAGMPSRPEPVSERARDGGRAVLGALLDDSGDDLGRAAAWALGALGPGRAAPALVRALFLKRDEVRRAAWLGLAGAAARRWPELGRDADGLDVALLFGRLGELATTAAETPPQAALAAAQGHEDVAAEAIADALGRHRDLVLRALDDLAAAPPATVTALAPRLVPALDRLAGHEDAAVRARVAALAPRLPDAAARLGRALASDSAQVRLAALGALAAAPAPLAGANDGLRRGLERALAAPSWRERRQAALALRAHGELYADRGRALVAPLGRDASGFVREAAR